MMKVALSKIQDAERAFQILSRMAQTENLYFSSARGLECYILPEISRKSLLYLHLHPDFFDSFQVTRSLQVGIHLTEMATELHQAYQLSHMKLLTLYDSPEGQLIIEGKNPNGIESRRAISPLPVETPHMYDFTAVPTSYPFAIDLPSRVFHAQLKKHERSKTLAISFDSGSQKLILNSDKQHGLISEAEDGFLLRPENIVKLPHSPETLPGQLVYVDTKYLSIMMRFEKLAHVVRLWMATNKPAVFEYIMQLSPRNPCHNSSLQLRIGTTTRERHPYVE